MILTQSHLKTNTENKNILKNNNQLFWRTKMFQTLCYMFISIILFTPHKLELTLSTYHMIRLRCEDNENHKGIE
jgi:hypothetical protein